jgi:type I restriction enzyme M protein
MNLSSTIKSIQDIMRKDDGVDGDAQRIGQLTWMLFLKVFDQREEEKEKAAEAGGPPYTSPLPEKFRWRNWAAYKGDKSEAADKEAAKEIVAFVNNELFHQLKILDVPAEPMSKVIRQVFEDSNNYMKSGALMLDVIKKLNGTINSTTSRHGKISAISTNKS